MVGMAFKLRAIYRPCRLMAHSALGKKLLDSTQSYQFSASLCTNVDSSIPGTHTVVNVLNMWENRFKAEDIPEPQESIRNIVLHVLGGRNFTDLEKYAKVELTKEELEEMNKLCECRLARMPIQYVIGEWQFRGMRLRMSPPVFIPRPETEQLVDLALQCLPHGNECNTCEISEGCKLHVLEVGVGSGAVSLALMKAHPKVNCVAVDQSGMACQLTQENASELGVADRINVVHSKLKEEGRFSEDIGSDTFDLIVSNPPYVPSKDLSALDPEIMLYEDLRALDGGADGLKLIKPLLQASSHLLQHKGRVLLEVDATHPDAVRAWLEAPGQAGLRLRYEATHKDMFGKPRFVQVMKMRNA